MWTKPIPLVESAKREIDFIMCLVTWLLVGVFYDAEN